MAARPDTRTYLPVPVTADSFLALGARDYAALAELPAWAGPYERVGFDRLVAIASDLDLLSVRSARVLDVGCNSGLFTLGLASLGHQTTGVESNIAADVQGFYPGKILDLAEQSRAGTQVTGATLVEGDVESFLEQTSGRWDVCLLLSVVHQWSAGYASTGEGAKARLRVETLLRKLVARVSSLIYFEGPDLAPGPDAVPLPSWFLDEGLVARCTVIGQSPAANGDLRTLFRLER